MGNEKSKCYALPVSDQNLGENMQKYQDRGAAIDATDGNWKQCYLKQILKALNFLRSEKQTEYYREKQEMKIL
jgi:hypothetical protein